MTERLYYNDSYLTGFEARIAETSADRMRVYLDRTGFYPTSGGQPFDLGTLGGVPITEVADEDDRIVHVLSAPLPDRPIQGQIDWQRRFDHMQQHTGQHVLSSVLIDLLNAQTVSFHMGAASSTIDLAKPSLEPEEIRAVMDRANQIVFENRPVSVSFEDASSEELGLRKKSEREGVLRIVSIQNLDRSACGGTHVRATGEIGPILIRKVERMRGNARVEFLCGMRAVKRAHLDYEALSTISRIYSASLDETPALVAGQFEKLQEADKARRKLVAEVAAARGRELYTQTAPNPDGVRKLVRRIAALTDDARMEAQGFTEGSKAMLLMLADDPPAVLAAASKDTGWNAGQWLKTELAKAGGRGGGSATTAQGSVPGKEALDELAKNF